MTAAGRPTCRLLAAQSRWEFSPGRCQPACHTGLVGSLSATLCLSFTSRGRAWLGV